METCLMYMKVVFTSLNDVVISVWVWMIWIDGYVAFRMICIFENILLKNSKICTTKIPTLFVLSRYWLA